MHEFNEADAQVLGINTDLAQNPCLPAMTAHLKFPVLSDAPERNVFRLWVSADDTKLFFRCRTFVVDKQGTIRGKIVRDNDVLFHVLESLALVQELEDLTGGAPAERKEQ